MQKLDEMGADYIAVHTGYDLQAEGQSPLTVYVLLNLSLRILKFGGIKPIQLKILLQNNLT